MLVGMDGERGSRLGSFLIGGLVGSVAGVAAVARMRVRERRPRVPVAGLAAFEQAPCFRELLEREAAERAPSGEDGGSLR
jgi:hypothetical protein